MACPCRSRRLQPMPAHHLPTLKLCTALFRPPTERRVAAAGAAVWRRHAGGAPGSSCNCGGHLGAPCLGLVARAGAQLAGKLRGVVCWAAVRGAQCCHGRAAGGWPLRPVPAVGGCAAGHALLPPCCCTPVRSRLPTGGPQPHSALCASFLVFLPLQVLCCLTLSPPHAVRPGLYFTSFLDCRM